MVKLLPASGPLTATRTKTRGRFDELVTLTTVSTPSSYGFQTISRQCTAWSLLGRGRRDVLLTQRGEGPAAAEQVDRVRARVAAREPRVAEDHRVGLEGRDRLLHVRLLVRDRGGERAVEARELRQPERPLELGLELLQVPGQRARRARVPVHGHVVDLAALAGGEEVRQPGVRIGLIA